MIRSARLGAAAEEQGADVIKIFASKSERVGAGPTFTEDQLRVLCSEAAWLGMRTMVHAYRSQSAAAARAGCRQVEHLTYGTQADVDAVVKAGAFIGPQVGLVVQNYLENKARYLAGGFTEEGMAIMERDLPLDFAICTMAVKTPGAKVVFSTDATAAPMVATPKNSLAGWSTAGRHRWRRSSRRARSPPKQSAWATALARGAGLRHGHHRHRRRSGHRHHGSAPLVFVMRGGVVYKWAGSKRTRE